MTEKELMEKSCPYRKGKCKGSGCAMFRERGGGGTTIGYSSVPTASSEPEAYCGLAGLPRK